MAIFSPDLSIPVSCNSISSTAKYFHSFRLSKSFIISLLFLIGCINISAANITAGISDFNWTTTQVGGASYSSSDNISFPSNWNNTYNLTSNVTCVNLTIGYGTTINLNGFTLTTTGDLTISNNTVSINVGSGKLSITGNLSMTNYYSSGIFTSASGLVEIAGNITTSNNGSVMAGGTSGFAGTMKLTGASSPIITLNSGPIAVAKLDWNCKTPTSLPSGFTAANIINAGPCSSTLSATPLPVFGNVCTNSTTSPISFTINAFGLNSTNLTIGALSGYTYSTTYGGPYSGTLSIPQAGGPAYSQTIYVKFTPTSVSSYNGNIVVGGGGASNINVATVGSGSNSVVPSITSPSSSNILTTSAILGGTITIAGCSSQDITERGINYSLTDGFPDGTGTKVSETGTFGSGIFTENVTGLLTSKVYYYKAFAKNNAGTVYSSQGTFNNIPRDLYYANGGGNWSNLGNWRIGNCGGTTATTLPSVIDNVFIVCGWGGSPVVLDITANCNNLTIDQSVELRLNGNTLNVFGNAIVASTNQGTLTVDNGFLNISKNLTLQRNNGANFNWDSGSVTISGNFTDNDGWGNFGGTRTGFLIMNGITANLTTSANISIPKFRQPTSGFTKTGGGNLTISNIFDQNCGPAAPSGVIISVPGNTLNSTCLPTITGSPITGSPFCPGSLVSIPFTITRTYTSGNIFTAQLSGSTGSFASPVNIGTLTSTTAGTISGTIPAGTSSGNGYRIRVISSAPVITGTDNGSNLTVNPLTVILSQSTATQTKCIGAAFASISINASGAGVLSYQWYSNTTSVASGGSSLGSSNGAQTNSYTPQSASSGTLYYYCVVTGTCSSATSAISGAFIVNPITAITGQSTLTQTCCQTVSFTSISITASGVGLTYQWYSNTLAVASGGINLGTANGAQTSSYTPQSTTAGTLYYYCVVSGTCSSATSAISGAFITNPVLPVSIVITPSSNPVYEGTAVTITASPTNGGTNPHYLWRTKGNPVGTDNPVYSYTPVNGDYITCELTSNASPCATGSPSISNTVTMIVNANKWQGNNGNDWNSGANWLGGYVPTEGYNVEFASDVKNDLYLDQDHTIGKLINSTNKSLVIPPAFCLTVTDSIISNDVTGDRILIKSSSGEANGSLIFHNKTTKVYGTVEMYSKAFCLSPLSTPKTGYRWEYFGIPVRSVSGSPTFDGSFVRRWEETAQIINTHWVYLSNTSVLTPFTGYEITQDQAKTLTFQGQLLNSDTTLILTLTNSPALYPGQHIISNPYTSAINIKNLNFISGLDAVVYLYNTGSYDEWNANPGTISQGNGNAGQFNSIPINVAGYDSGLPGQIPSMQGFMVIANTNNALFKIPYSAVEINTIAQRVKSAQDTIVLPSTRIEVIGSHATDRMWIFTRQGCTRNYDNGWDGSKLPGNVLSPQIFAIEPDGNYQVDAIDDINNTQIGFQAGEDTKYTLTFTHQNIKNKYPSLFLVDLVENKTINITESGSTYSFIAESTPTTVKRFIITRPESEKEELDKGSHFKVFNSGNAVMVENLSKQEGEMVIYDLLGRCMKKVPVDPTGVTTVQIGAIAGSYVIKVSSGKEIVSKRIFIGK